MRSLARDFVNLFYPETCYGCNTSLVAGENLVCTLCKHQLPNAFEETKSTDIMSRLFYGRIPIEHVTSLFYYEKIGTVQRLIHSLKYQGNEEVGDMMGKWLASMLKNDPRFNDVDLVVPVPIHPKRRRQRGYNQVTRFGERIADGLGARFRESVIAKTTNTIKQAQLDQQHRSDERKSPYSLQEDIAEFEHILLVDDVITTGTTLSMCARVIAASTDVKISVASMAISV